MVSAKTNGGTGDYTAFARSTPNALDGGINALLNGAEANLKSGVRGSVRGAFR
jgi:hypothetical protein